MKKTMMTSLALWMVITTVSAQSGELALKNEIYHSKAEETNARKDRREERKALRKIEANQVSEVAVDHFFRDFGNVLIDDTRRTDLFDEFVFTQDGVSTTAFYDQDGELVGTTAAKSFSDLPEKAQSLIDRKYGDYTTEAVILFDDNESNPTDMVLYDQSFEDADNYFVELKKDNHRIVLQVSSFGEVSYFKRIS